MHYIAETLLTDARAAIGQSLLQKIIGHKGLRGALREDILLRMMDSRLPYFLQPGKGTIIDSIDTERLEGEDDIILYDYEITPPIKMYSKSTNGVYHFNGVLGRIEVKSTLEASDFLQFVERSKIVTRFRLDTRATMESCGAYNFLFGYDSKADKKCEITRFYEACDKTGVDPVSGVASVLCILGKGVYRLWGEQNRRFWQVAKADKEPAQQLVRFISMVSEMSLQLHIARTGRRLEQSLEISIGNYLWDPLWEEVVV